MLACELRDKRQDEVMHHPDLIAIVPAAGHSRRMGQPKLLLPWRGTTVIAHLVQELRAAGVAHVFVVLRADDAALNDAVIQSGATPVMPPREPPDMRTSVEYGLQAASVRTSSSISNSNGTTDRDWLLIPADHPIVSRTTVATLLQAWTPKEGRILIPTYNGKRGHPTLFSAKYASEVSRIPPDCGLNWLVQAHSDSIQEVPVADPGVIIDLDTPEDYEVLLRQSGQST
jgi:molybdenum cofactor cytidylyltransferase